MSDLVREQVEEAMRDIDFTGLVSMAFSINDYYDVLRGIVDNREGYHAVLVAASMPNRLLLDTLDSLGSDVRDIRAIDCISYCVLGDPHGEAIYIESPSILEKVLMSLEVVRRESQKPLLVVVDSFNAFHLHNDYRTMSAFLQILAHRLKNNGDVGVLLSLKEHGTVENDNLMHLISERSLEF